MLHIIVSNSDEGKHMHELYLWIFANQGASFPGAQSERRKRGQARIETKRKLL